MSFQHDDSSVEQRGIVERAAVRSNAVFPIPLRDRLGVVRVGVGVTQRSIDEEVDATRRMKAVTDDSESIECTSVEEAEHGVRLLDGAGAFMGYVPYETPQYVTQWRTPSH